MRGGAEVRLVTPTGTVPSAQPLVLQWHQVPNAVSYSVEVLTADGSVVSGGKTLDTTFAVPDSVHLMPSRRYLWWVRAYLADGSERRSPMQSFEVGS